MFAPQKCLAILCLGRKPSIESDKKKLFITISKPFLNTNQPSCLTMMRGFQERVDFCLGKINSEKNEIASLLTILDRRAKRRDCREGTTLKKAQAQNGFKVSKARRTFLRK